MIDKLYNMYGVYMKLLCYERAISRFIDDLDLKCKKNSRILDVGCGTGIIGLQLIEKFQNSTLLATDAQEKFLYETIANAKKKRISKDRISVGISDITTPDKVKILDDYSVSLKKESFDIVSFSGVVGYSKNQKESIITLLSLIKPNGYLIDLEMNEKPVGKWIASRYHYNVMSLIEMIKLIEDERYEVFRIPLSLKYFPANLTRIGIVAKKISD